MAADASGMGNDGTLIGGATFEATTTIGPMSLAVEDMDSDGDFDFVLGEHTSDIVNTRTLIFENADGNGTTWIEHSITTGLEHHAGTQALDGDGDLDISTLDWFGRQMHVLENLN